MRNGERTVDMTEEMNNTSLTTVNCNQPEQKKKEKTLRIACYTQAGRLEYEMNSRNSLQTFYFIAPPLNLNLHSRLSKFTLKHEVSYIDCQKEKN
jgi:hypothetical protein